MKVLIPRKPEKGFGITAEPEKIDPLQMLKDHAEKQLVAMEKQGVVLFYPEDVSQGGKLNIDPDNLELPPNITDVPARSLGEYLNAFTQQKMFMRTLYGRETLKLEKARSEYYKASADLYESFSDRKFSETAKDRLISVTPEVQPYFENMSACQNRLAILDQNIMSIEEAIFMISREISRRTGDFNEENRNHNVGRK